MPTQEQTAARRAEVVRLTRLGRSAPEIAEIIGITPRTVQRHRQAAGISAGPAIPLSAHEKERALSLLQDGASYAEVGRTLGRSEDRLQVNFPGYGWTREQTGAHNAAIQRARHAEARRRRRTGS